MMKKLIAILLLGALLLLSVVGCNVPDENVGTTPDATIESTTPVPLPDRTTPDIPNVTTPSEQDTTPSIIIVPPYDNLFDGTEKEFVADAFDERVLVSSSWPIKINVLIKDTQIFINDILYESVTVVENPQITYEESYLRALEVGQEVQKLKILAQIKNSNSCYILETTSDNRLGKKIAIFYVGNVYYFISFYNERVFSIFQVPYSSTLPAEDNTLA